MVSIDALKLSVTSSGKGRGMVKKEGKKIHKLEGQAVQVVSRKVWRDLIKNDNLEQDKDEYLRMTLRGNVDLLRAENWINIYSI